MKTLYESIFDAFDDEGNVTTDSSELIKQEIIEWIEKNFKGSPTTEYSFEEKMSEDNKYIVNASSTIKADIKINSLTNGQFVWGVIDGSFKVNNCEKLTSLEGAPREITNQFNCSDCKKLKSLKGAPEIVKGAFDCGNCEKLTSLEGAPQITGAFYCDSCSNLKSLKGAPKKIDKGPSYLIGSFKCPWCTSLTSLEGAPKYVKDHFSCAYCSNLKSLKGAPEKVGGDFDCSECGIQFTEEDVKKVSKVKKHILLD